MKTNRTTMLAALGLLLAFSVQGRQKERVNINFNAGYHTEFEMAAINVGVEVPLFWQISVVPSGGVLIDGKESEVNLDLRTYIVRKKFRWYLLTGYGRVKLRGSERWIYDPNGANLGMGFGLKLKENLIFNTQGKFFFSIYNPHFLIQGGIGIVLPKR